MLNEQGASHLYANSIFFMTPFLMPFYGRATIGTDRRGKLPLYAGPTSPHVHRDPSCRSNNYLLLPTGGVARAKDNVRNDVYGRTPVPGD